MNKFSIALYSLFPVKWAQRAQFQIPNILHDFIVVNRERYNDVHTSLWITSFTFSDHDLISLCHCQGHRGTCLIVIGQTESCIFLLSSYPIDCFVIEFKRCMVVMLHMHAERENYAYNAFCKFGMHSVLNSFDA